MYTVEGSSPGGRKAGGEPPRADADRLLAMLRDEFELVEVPAKVAARVLGGRPPGIRGVS
jgi:hypothetical protein